jgi:hypothetical protein
VTDSAVCAVAEWAASIATTLDIAKRKAFLINLVSLMSDFWISRFVTARRDRRARPANARRPAKQLRCINPAPSPARRL